MAVPLTLKAITARIDSLSAENPPPLSVDCAVLFARAAAETSPVVKMHAVIECLLEEQTHAALDPEPLELLVACLRQCIEHGFPARYGQDYPAALAAAENLLPPEPVED